MLSKIKNKVHQDIATSKLIETVGTGAFFTIFSTSIGGMSTSFENGYG
jgi:hypothetical protein